MQRMVAKASLHHCEKCQLLTSCDLFGESILSAWHLVQCEVTLRVVIPRHWEFFGLQCFLRNICHSILFSLVLCGLISRAGESKAQVVSSGYYRLHFFHTHTRERLDIVYRDAEGYNQESLVRLENYL